MPPFVRLAPEQLEARDNPSLPQLAPFGGVVPIPAPPPDPPVAVAVAPATPVAPVAPAPVGFWWRVAVDCTAGPMLATHSVYKMPLVWPVLPR